MLLYYLDYDYTYYESLVSYEDDENEDSASIDYSAMMALPSSVLSDTYKSDLEWGCEKTLGLCTATDDDASASDEAASWDKAEQWMKCYVNRYPSPTDTTQDLIGYVSPHLYPYAAYPASVYASLFQCPSPTACNYTGSATTAMPPLCVDRARRV